MSLKNIIIAGMLSTTILMSVAANADEMSNFYVQLNGGAALGLAPKGDFGTKKAGNSALFGAEAGYQFDEHLRTSVSLDYLSKFSFTDTIVETENAGLDKLTSNYNYKVKSLVAMVNFYYDIMEAKGFTPYVTVGAGMARNQTTVSGTWFVTGTDTADGTISYNKYTKNNFAWRVGLGARYALNQNVVLDLSYRFSDLGKIATSTGTASGTSKEGKTASDSLPAKQNGKLRAHEVLFGVAYKF